MASMRSRPWDDLRIAGRVAIKRGLPVSLIFFVTSRCNLLCRHCFYWEELNKKKGELELPEIEKIAKSLPNLLTVSLTGGEPYLRPDLPEIASAFEQYAGTLGAYVADTSLLLQESLQRGEMVLAEGAQGALLDLDHGTYPYVTSSGTGIAGALAGLGAGARDMQRILGVVKAFQTRVGEGPFPTEETGDIGNRLRGSGSLPWDEFGTTTGRPRRCGWLDLVLLRYAARFNGLTELVITKLDILSGLKEIRLCTAYKWDGRILRDPPLGLSKLEDCEPVYEDLPGWEEDIRKARSRDQLPAAARDYLARIEAETGLPISMVSVGSEREECFFCG